MTPEQLQATVKSGEVISDVDLTGAELDGAILRGGVFEHVRFDGASMRESRSKNPSSTIAPSKGLASMAPICVWRS